MQQIVFEFTPAYLLVCAVLALGTAYLLYKHTHPWGKNANRFLFACRSVLIFFLLALLLGPIIRQISNWFEKPVFVILQDNSTSVVEMSDSSVLARVATEFKLLEDRLTTGGYDVQVSNLDGKAGSTAAATSDLQGALRRVTNQFEGRKISGVVLASDGIYNSGLSPLYANFNFPVYTLGLGDTSSRMDVSIRNIAYNKIAYQGNRFPLRVEVMGQNIPRQAVQVTLLQRGKVIDQQNRDLLPNEITQYDFQPQANEQGIQKYDIQVEIKNGEVNTRNNHGSVFVEVVEGKKKILLVSPAPHPDIKVLREVIEKNSNYEFMLHIAGVKPLQDADMDPRTIDLAIFHQSPDLRGATAQLFKKFSQSQVPLFVIVGQQSDLRQIVQDGMPIRMESVPREFDEVTPVANPTFPNFSISTEANSLLVTYPPLSVHFGKITVPLEATPLLYQQVGSLVTQKPLLAVDGSDRKIAVLLGEGIWRWRLSEFDRTENTFAFDEVFGKLIQFLSTSDDKRKFRSYPVQQEFLDTGPVVIESQVYNDVFEPVYGNTIEIQLTDESGRRTRYSYGISPGNTRYRIGGLKEGVYRYQSKTTINQKEETVRGEFAVVSQQVELQNLTADHALLRQLSANTGGKFFPASKVQQLQEELGNAEAQSIIHSTESYESVINLKWVFLVLIAMLSVEWFFRKFWGAY